MTTLYFYQLIGATLVSNALTGVWVYAIWRARRVGLEGISWTCRFWLLVPLGIVFLSAYSLT